MLPINQGGSNHARNIGATEQNPDSAVPASPDNSPSGASHLAATLLNASNAPTPSPSRTTSPATSPSGEQPIGLLAIPAPTDGPTARSTTSEEAPFVQRSVSFAPTRRVRRFRPSLSPAPQEGRTSEPDIAQPGASNEFEEPLPPAPIPRQSPPSAAHQGPSSEASRPETDGASSTPRLAAQTAPSESTQQTLPLEPETALARRERDVIEREKNVSEREEAVRRAEEALQQKKETLDEQEAALHREKAEVATLRVLVGQAASTNSRIANENHRIARANADFVLAFLGATQSDTRTE